MDIEIKNIAIDKADRFDKPTEDNKVPLFPKYEMVE
jgi:hypothetical protein